MNSNVIVTTHAKTRLKERHGVKSDKKAQRICDNAFTRGITEDRAKGALKKWITRKTKAGTYIACYQTLAFVFSLTGECITVLQIPPEIHRKMKKMALPA